MRVTIARVTMAQFAYMLVCDAKRRRYVNPVLKPRSLETVSHESGINPVYLRQMEQGRRPVSLRQALRIHDITTD